MRGDRDALDRRTRAFTRVGAREEGFCPTASLLNRGRDANVHAEPERDATGARARARRERARLTSRHGALGRGVRVLPW